MLRHTYLYSLDVTPTNYSIFVLPGPSLCVFLLHGPLHKYICIRWICAQVYLYSLDLCTRIIVLPGSWPSILILPMILWHYVPIFLYSLDSTPDHFFYSLVPCQGYLYSPGHAQTLSYLYSPGYAYVDSYICTSDSLDRNPSKNCCIPWAWLHSAQLYLYSIVLAKVYLYSPTLPNNISTHSLGSVQVYLYYHTQINLYSLDHAQVYLYSLDPAQGWFFLYFPDRPCEYLHSCLCVSSTRCLGVAASSVGWKTV